jgi:hypothetical protein
MNADWLELRMRAHVAPEFILSGCHFEGFIQVKVAIGTQLLLQVRRVESRVVGADGDRDVAGVFHSFILVRAACMSYRIKPVNTEGCQLLCLISWTYYFWIHEIIIIYLKNDGFAEGIVINRMKKSLQCKQALAKTSMDLTYPPRAMSRYCATKVPETVEGHRFL